jgi:hypothetical protein
VSFAVESVRKGDSVRLTALTLSCGGHEQAKDAAARRLQRRAAEGGATVMSAGVPPVTLEMYEALQRRARDQPAGSSSV